MRNGVNDAGAGKEKLPRRLFLTAFCPVFAGQVPGWDVAKIG
jgi:hypothetical protein